MSDDDLRDRARGALAGVAVGDAFGAPFEGRPRVRDDELDRVLSGSDPLRYTDDTAMAIVLARTLVQRRGLDEAYLAEAFASAYAEEPWRGYGAGPPRIFAMLEDGVAWDDAASRLFGGEGSLGNGGAMRVAPVAVLCAGDLGETAALARRSAAVTHAHPLGRDGAAAQACAVGALLTGAGAGGAGTVLPAVLEHVEQEALRERLTAVGDLAADATPEEIAAVLGNGVTVVESVPAALCAALRHLDEPERAVRFAIAIGGDTDTIAAMAGALVGAHVGWRGLPPSMRRRAEGTGTLAALAEELLDTGRAQR